MKTRHTPGPWFARIEDDKNLSFISISNHPAWDKDALCIAEAKGGKVGPQNIKETIANAKLIASAPELLEALKQIANTSSDAPEAMRVIANNAIKKAQP